MKTLFLIHLLILLIITKVPAQKRYSLTDCYQVALNQNTSIKRAENEINADVIDKKTALYNLLPSVSYGMQHSISSGKNINPVTNNFIHETFSGGSLYLGVQLKIFSGFNAINSIKEAQYVIDAAEYSKKKVELDLLQQITLAYSRLLFNKEQSAIESSNIAKTSREWEITSEKVKLGKVSKYELLALDARKNSEQADLINVQNDSLTALQGLKQLLNIPYKEEIDIEPIDTTTLLKIIATNISSTDFIDRMLQKHPAIREAKMQEQVARMDLKISNSSFFPSLSIGSNLTSRYKFNKENSNGPKVPLPDQLNTNFGQSLSINLQVPIFSQMKTASRTKKEKINISNAAYTTQEMENSVISSSLQLINDFNSAKQAFIATSAAWRAANLYYSIYQEKYKLGQVNSLELITAKDMLSTADSKYLQAKMDLFFRYQLLDLVKSVGE